MATATAPHPVTLNGTGNVQGPTGYRTCTACDIRKPITEFRAYADNKRETQCRKCCNARTRAWKERTDYHARQREERARQRGGQPKRRLHDVRPTDTKAIDAETARAVWATILRHTIDQMRAPKPRVRADTEYSRAGLRTWARNRAEATCWLGSRQATPVFEMLGYDQEVHLPRIRWSEYARAVLDGQAEWGLLEEDRRRLLEDGIRYLRGERRCTNPPS